MCRRVADLLPALSEEALSGLMDTRAGERHRLLETVHEYVVTGSVQDTAALYCHRNTVVNRLRRFAELTGYDVTVRERRHWYFSSAEPRLDGLQQQRELAPAEHPSTPGRPTGHANRRRTPDAAA